MPLSERDYLSHDGLGLAELVRRREVTPAELVETAIARIERLNPAVNAVIHRMDDSARATARGPLPDGPFRGVPFLLKDLIATVAGVPFRAGSRFLRDYVPDHDSELVRRYRAAGFVFLGKTNTPEFGLTPFTEPRLFGPTRNPWDLTRTPGGSSGGSAAAVASGMVPLASGGDGGGSIRIPASCCGLFGMKPSRGQVPTGPDFGEIWQGAVVEHVVTRSVRDSAAVLDATAGEDVGAPYAAPSRERPFLEEVDRAPGPLRVGVCTTPLLGRRVDPACVAAVEETARLLTGLGHRVEEVAVPLDGPLFARAFLTMVCAELRGDIEDAEVILKRKAAPREFEPATWALGLLGRALPASDLSRARRHLYRVSREVSALFERCDVLLTPTLASPPFPTGALQPSRGEDRLLRVLGRLRAGRLLRAARLLERTAAEVFEFIPWTPVFNITGQPAMSVPLVWSDGLPVGVHFVAPLGGEGRLYRLAGQLERERPWFDRLAPLAVGGAEGSEKR